MFFGAFLGPIFAILLFNTVIFVIIITVLIKHSKKKFDREVDQGKRKTTLRLMFSIVGVMSIFGLAWFFGALTVVRRSFAIQVLFAIFNSLQGFMIFLFFCVVNKESRDLWTELICRRKKLQTSSFVPSMAGKQGSSTLDTVVRSKTSNLLPSGRETRSEASLGTVKSNPVAHELSVLEEEKEVQQHRKMENNLPHSSPSPSNESGIVKDELQGEASLQADETDPQTIQARESSIHDEGGMGLIEVGNSDEQDGADGVAGAMIDGNTSDGILEVVINQHAEDD